MNDSIGMGDSTSVAASAAPPEAEALRSILATVPDAMVVIDEAGLILSFSAAAEKMFGFSESEIVGCNVKMLMPSPDRERRDQYLADYLSTGTRKIIGVGRATTALHRDGNTFPIELAVGETWSGGKRIFTGFIRDLWPGSPSSGSIEQIWLYNDAFIPILGQKHPRTRRAGHGCLERGARSAAADVRQGLQWRVRPDGRLLTSPGSQR